MAAISRSWFLGPKLSIILIQLLPLISGLTLPVDVCTPGSACTTNATSANTSTSLTAMRPAPSVFIISHTDFRIVFRNNGGAILFEDANECISEALIEIKHELDTILTDIDIPISGNLVFTSGSAELRLNTGEYMWRTYCLMLMVGVLEWGHIFGFFEVDMEFVEQREGARRTLGTGSLRLRNAAS